MHFTPFFVLPDPLPAATRVFVCGDNGVQLRRDESGFEALPTLEEVRALGLEKLDEAQMVGEVDGQPCIAVSRLETTPFGSAFEFVGLRSLWARLDETLFGIAGRANQLAHFARTHRFCGQCGTRQHRAPTERAFRCPTCQLVSYPRISPAIITLVRRGDEALLAQSGRVKLPFFSTLAGFSEVGESLEETLVREVAEEVGLTVGNVRYFGSQSWPFPHSLMIGFTAEYVSGSLRIDGDEIKAAQFFKADALPMIPPKLSIARHLIDAWVTEVTGRPAV